MLLNQHIFREYDIRGLVGTDLTDESVKLLARSVGTFFKRNGVKRVSIGYDARVSSPVFSGIFTRELNGAGLDVLNVGMVPTPLLYFSLFTEPVDAGVMITGSHNPSEFNGFKVCLGKSSIHGAQIQEIKEISIAGEFEKGNGKADEKDVIRDYLSFVVDNVKLGNRILKVVVDSGNGIGGIVGVPLYKMIGCEVIDILTEPDSRFPNHHPDPTVEENLQHAIAELKECGADLAIAFDGDGDRIGIVDEKGKIIWGDELMSIFARTILETKKDATFIAEVKCSQRLFDDIENRGGTIHMSKVGHSLIKAKMKETRADLAGEMSGHIFFADRFFGFDDAIYAGARLLEILSNSDQGLSEFLADLPEVANTPEIRIPCADSRKFQLVSDLTEHFKKTNDVIDIDGARILFEDGWGLVRASNTQPVLVLRFEAWDEESLGRIRGRVESCVKKLLDAVNSSS